MAMTDHKYVSFTTFTRRGERKATPVWIVEIGGKAGFTTGSGAWKLKRLSNDPRCELQPCDRRGAVGPDAMIATGTAQRATPDEYRMIREAIGAKYGVAAKLASLAGRAMALRDRSRQTSDTAVIITFD